MKRLVATLVFVSPDADARTVPAGTMEVDLKLKMLGLLGALVFAVPVVAEAAPAGGMTAQSAAPSVTQAVETNAAVDANGPVAKVDKVWWRGGYGRGFGWRGGYGYRRFGYGYGFRRPFFGGYYGYGYRRPFFRRRFWY